MPEYKSNEWVFQGEVVSWLNEFLSTGSYPFDSATQNTSLKVTDSKTKFPDVQLWLNQSAKLGFCGWELKTPTTKVDDQKLLNDAAEKAHVMQATFFVTWNMREAIIWQTPKTSEIVKAEHRIKQYPILYAINNADDLTNAQHKMSLKNRAKEILDDLATLKTKGHLHSIVTDATYFVKKLHTTVDNLYPDIEKSLKSKIGLDVKFRKELITWARKQGIGNTVSSDFYKMVSRQMVYRLLARIIFYEAISNKFTHLPKLNLDGLSGQKAADRLKELFSEASNVDWQAVFEYDLADTVELSDNSVDVIHKLIDDLNAYNFSFLPQDVMGAVFEKLIPPEERHTLGQYFTRENLVDIINAFCIRTINAKLLDPTCGTGTFLLRAYNKKKTGGLYDHKELLSQLWGIDIAHFPAELATINLFRQSISETTNFPRIICKDFFDIQPESIHKFPPLKKVLDPNYQSIDEKMPMFDAAVGNFPFIKQELIEDAQKGYKNKLEKVIKEEWLAEYPDAFSINEGDKQYILDAYKNGKKVTKYNADLKLSGQADIYAYLFFHTARFIKEGGRMGFVTSNSWLDADYGYELQKFMLNNFKIVAILESRCEPWFEDAAINTVVTILERCSNKAERDRHIAKFVKIKRKLSDLIPQDMKQEATERWYNLDSLTDWIEKSGDSHLGFDKTGKQVNNLTGLATEEDDNFRVRLKTQSELLDELITGGITAKWGQYLRAPEVYFDILEKSKNKLIQLKTIATVSAGCYTGINDFFYVKKDKITHWNIEDEFLVPVVRSPREASGILIDEGKLATRLVLCKKSKSELLKEQKQGILQYINWGEKQVTQEKQKVKAGISWSQVPTVKNRKPGWWSIPKCLPTRVFISYVISDTYAQRYSEKPLISDRCFHMISPFNVNEGKTLSASLNSSLVNLLMELTGRVNLGEGALKFETEDAKHLLVPNPNSIDQNTKEKVIESFDALSKREVKSIFEEVKMKDRQKLDSLILETLGLDPKIYLKPLYEGLTELVKERIELGTMRTKVKKAKIATDTEKLTSQIIEAVLPNGVKKFPEDFLDKPLKPAECETLSLPAEPLKLGGQFLTEHEVITDQGFKIMVKSNEMAKYIVYSQKPNLYLISIPTDEKATTKAVQDYEIYLKELRNTLISELSNLIQDYKRVDSVTERIFAMFGLPKI